MSVAYAAGLAVVWFVLVAPALSHETNVPAAEAATTAAPLPVRPAHLPRAVPAWAWRLYRWHATPSARRGPRPFGVPRPIPDWYWRWRAWRVKVARVAR